MKQAAIKKYSVFTPNADLVDVDEWNEEMIEKRGTVLAKAALSIWSRPRSADIGE